MQRQLLAVMTTLLLMLGICSQALAAPNTWTGSTPPGQPFATGLGDRVITALAVSPDGGTVYAGTGSGTIFSYAVTPPSAVTDAADSVTATTATLNGTVNPHNATGEVFFEYGLTTAYGSKVDATTNHDISGSGNLAATLSLTGLTPGSIYHFRVVVQTTSGETVGGDQSFTTLKLNQTISFNPAPTVVVNGTGTVSASGGGSGNTVTFSTTSTDCSLSGATVTGLFAGTNNCVIKADQAGNSAYNDAPQATLTFSIGKGTPTISVTPGTYTYNGSAQGPVAADVNKGGSTGAVTMSYSGTGGTVYGPSGTLPTNAGSYTATASVAADSNYLLASSTDTAFSIGKAGQTLSFSQPAAVNFGSGTVDLSAYATAGASTSPVTFSILAGGTGSGSLSGANNKTLTITSAGTINLQADQAADVNYNAASPVQRTLTVNKGSQATLAITGPTTITYGDLDTTITTSGGSGSGAVTFDAGSSTACSIVSGKLHILSGTGSCAITASKASDNDYNQATSVSFDVTVAKANQTITFNTLAAKSYGDADFGAGASASSGLAVTYSSDTPTVATVTTGGLIHIVGAGGATITASQAGDDNYNSATASQGLVVDKATLMVQANNASRPAGVANPTFTASYSGFVNGETGAVLSGTPDFVTPADLASAAGEYPILPLPGTLASANYSFTYFPGILAVDLQSQTITFNQLPVKTYGDAPFTISATSSSANPIILQSTNLSVATIAGTTVTIVGPGSALITATQAGTATHASAIAMQFLTVEKAPLTVAADNASKLFGNPNPLFTYTATGFIAPDNLLTACSGAPDLATAAILASPAGSYPITAAAGTLSCAKYNPVFVNGVLAVGISSQNITFTALPAKTYGDADFTLTATGGGSGNPVTFTSSNPAVATVSGDSVTITGAGKTTITASQAGNNSYAPAAAQQTLTVSKAPLTVSADAKNKTYGAANPPLTTSYSGFTGSDTAAVLAGAPVVSCIADASSATGSYPIVVASGNLTSKNYELSYSNNTLTVDKALLTVTADSKSKNPGQANPPLTVSYSGFVNGDSAASLAGAPLISTTAINSSPVGSYPIAVALGTLASANYDFTLVNGTLLVGKYNQSINFAALANRSIGSPDFTPGASASSGLTVSYSSSNPAVATVVNGQLHIVNPGSSTITASQAGNSEYYPANDVSQTLVVTYASQGPQLTLSTLPDNAVTSSNMLNVSGSVTAVNGLQEFTVNGSAVTLAGDGSFSLPITLRTGQNEIRFFALDLSGLQTTLSRFITLDQTAPLITTSGSSDNSVVSTTRTTISGSIDSSNTTVMISVNGGTPQPAVMTGTGFSLPVDLQPGNNTIIITATDASGKSSSIKQSITLNSALALAITTPAYDLKSGRDSMLLTGTINGTPPLTLTVTMDGQSFTPTVTGNSFSQQLSFTTEKSYQILVNASDSAGNSVNVSRNVIFARIGDQNGNGTMDIGDILTAFMISQGLQVPSWSDYYRCDVAPLDANGNPQGDGRIDIGDVVLLLRNYLGLISW